MYWANGYSYLNVAKGDSGISSLRVRICCLDGLINGCACCAGFGLAIALQQQNNLRRL
jgi:hypothetical protein